MRSISFLILLLTTLLFFPTLYGQTPGGVNTNLVLWVKANLGAAPAGGGVLTAWTDQTGINSFTLNTTGSVPIPPTVVLNAINFNPVVRFMGSLTTGTKLIGNTSINMSECSAVATFSGPLASERGSVVAPLNNTGDGSSRYFIRSAADANMYTGFGTAGSPAFTTGYEATNPPASGAVNVYTASGTGNVFNWNGLDARTFSINGGYLTTAMNDFPQIADRSTADSKMNGDIAEIVMYSAANSAALRNKVESYLALKYGVTMGNTGTPINYTSSAGTVFWTGSATYQNNVFGIGRDNGSALVQSTSNSMNSGSGNGTGQSGMGNLVLSAASALANQQYLVIGTDLQPLSEELISAAIGPSNAIGSNRVVRSWKVQNTGAVGSVNLSFDMTGLALSGGSIYSHYSLLIDMDGDGNFTTGPQNNVRASSITGNLLNFTGLTALTNGVVFTLLTLPSSTAVLATTWQDFTATATKNDVQLQWVLQNETGADHFSVERATDGMSFSRLALVAASGNSNAYQYQLQETGSGIFYYRIGAVLKDGTTVYSKVIAITIHAENTVQLKRNPVNGNNLELVFNAPASNDMQISIFNGQGSSVLLVNRPSPSPSPGNLVTVNIAALPAGMYFVRVREGANATTLPFVKQ